MSKWNIRLGEIKEVFQAHIQVLVMMTTYFLCIPCTELIKYTESDLIKYTEFRNKLTHPYLLSKTSLLYYGKCPQPHIVKSSYTCLCIINFKRMSFLENSTASNAHVFNKFCQIKQTFIEVKYIVQVISDYKHNMNLFKIIIIIIIDRWV